MPRRNQVAAPVSLNHMTDHRRAVLVMASVLAVFASQNLSSQTSRSTPEGLGTSCTRCRTLWEERNELPRFAISKRRYVPKPGIPVAPLSARCASERDG